MNLSWTPSTDNVGVTGYKVYRNQSTTALAILPGSATTYTDNTAKAGTNYSYQVTALDAVGNQSARAERERDDAVVRRRRLLAHGGARFGDR